MIASTTIVLTLVCIHVILVRNKYKEEETRTRTKKWRFFLWNNLKCLSIRSEIITRTRSTIFMHEKKMTVVLDIVRFDICFVVGGVVYIQRGTFSSATNIPHQQSIEHDVPWRVSSMEPRNRPLSVPQYIPSKLSWHLGSSSLVDPFSSKEKEF